MKRRPIIAVIGDGALPPNSLRARKAEKLGEALIDAGYRVLCGGLGGVMEAVCRGARNSAAHVDGDILGVLPGPDVSAANDYVDIPIATDMGHLRNSIVAHADAVVAIGGGAGTLSEISFAWIHNRLILAYRVDGWSGELADRRLDDRDRLPHVARDQIFGVDDARDVITELRKKLSDYMP